MAGEIYHEWNGTILTITSDSGTSSADLKGDTGPRGPQGTSGVANMVGYATEEYVQVKITEAQLNDSDVDLSAYYTKTEVDTAIQAAIQASMGSFTTAEGRAY